MLLGIFLSLQNETPAVLRGQTENHKDNGILPCLSWQQDPEEDGNVLNT